MKMKYSILTASVRRGLVLGTLGIGMLGLMPSVGAASEPSIQEQLEALQLQLQQQQTLIAAMQKEIDQQELTDKKMQAAGQAITQQAADTEQLAQQAGADVQQVAKSVGLDLSKVTDQIAPGDAHDVEIRGTNTVLSIAGFIRASGIYDFDQIESPTKFSPAHIVINGNPSDVPDTNTTFTVNASRFAIGSLTDTDKGQIKTYMEWDFDQNTTSASADFRMRQAWGEIEDIIFGGSLLVGQAWTTWDDIPTLPETMDFMGPNASQQNRSPMIRWIKDYGDDATLWLALEQPHYNVTGGSREGSMPDFIATVNWHGDWGHLKPAFVARQIRADNTMVDDTDSVFGWGIQLAGRVEMPFLGEKDNFKFQTVYGQGIGSFNDDGRFDDAMFTADGDMDTIDSFQIFGALQHWWSPTWRSNFVLGWVDVNNKDEQTDDSLNNTTYTAVNIVWSPMDKVTMGLEYLWGQRTNKNQDDGSASRIQFMTKVAF